ncbi:MAG: FKBP-type peptidyl-prolyl cis-trans isomerase [Sandaracinaceae bacterium]|jgi:FKBP-type peptidyl-prolyl cis-trans isomerase|nr:FKBP-type peptidyl-prolyl cis-trans isomerase [Sandaracinaceae bacterium]MBP7680666.1 FKBP-type peptidyl-prolyl cis-trans isomerase [Deltaproteobacteria bacterium]MBK6808067.1 FKBP-type peptidyl-prolyl cis-trans isomerase [Sandaracinaceae bacterium]MBK7150967.1 FKBP-type peptidyl-prolyl cis-trans isomerase [Sandaracinaceae bacterium]MBK7773090.1 FKBP-type peptidyl-prolyl cis-trans isomerase [Sandaracinaceae bacterium]
MHLASGYLVAPFALALPLCSGLLLGCGGASPSGSSASVEGMEVPVVTPTPEGRAAAPARGRGGPRPPLSLEAPVDVARPPAHAETTASGLASQVLWEGDGGPRPRAQDVVIAHYVGWTTDGEVFDSSVERGVPSEFLLSIVIAGWAEGLQLMTVGERRRLWIPESLAYDGAPGRPAGTLVYDVELIAIEASPPEVPADVAAAPSDAEVTATGLASRVLRAGSGTERPEASSTVTVHYSGWTTDGQMFDSSVARGRSATFRLNGVIPGWTEGLQLMVVGEKRRFWVPADLAYASNPRAPQGTLVFDVTLIHFE